MVHKRRCLGLFVAYCAVNCAVKEGPPLMQYAWAFLIGLASNLVTAVLLWLNRRRIVKGLQETWKAPGDVWWLACDLHSIKLQTDLGRVAEMKAAMRKALEHAQKLRIKGNVRASLEALPVTYADVREFGSGDREKIRVEVDSIIDRCGRLAEFHQPGYEP